MAAPFMKFEALMWSENLRATNWTTCAPCKHTKHIPTSLWMMVVVVLFFILVQEGRGTAERQVAHTTEACDATSNDDVSR